MLADHWNFWVGGLAIGTVAILLPLITGHFLGVTRGYSSVCGIFSKKSYFHKKSYGGKFGFRTLFLLGLILGGFLAALQSGTFNPSFSYGAFDKVFSSSLYIKAPILILGGVLWGYGARLAKGCTSGNSISGISKGSLASIVSTVCFMISGIITTFTLNAIMGAL